MSTENDKKGGLKLSYTKEMLEAAFNGRPMEEDHQHNKLLRAIKDHLDELGTLKGEAEGHWGSVDMFYRFYHRSFKVYRIQTYTVDMVALFEKIRDAVDWEPKPDRWHSPGRLDKDFLKIVFEGTGKQFDLSHNENWGKHTRPMMEAYFHAKTFLDMMIECGRRMDEASSLLPSDWAAVLYLFKMR